MLRFRDNVTTSQLLGCVQNVVSKKHHYSLIEMFCCEFLKDICSKFINETFKDRFQLSFGVTKAFREQIPLNFEENCCICGFELGVAKRYGPNSTKMT